MNLTFRQIQVFERVARRLSFTRAAEELYLTQPAVSMQIKQFEESVGLPLFERLGKKIYLTAAGEEMYRLSKVILRNLEEAGQVIEEMKGAAGGKLTVSVASTVHYFAIRLLAAFRQRYPAASINLRVTNRRGLLRQLEKNDTDIVLMGRPPEGHDLVAESFMENPLIVIAPPEHPLSAKRGIALKELQNETFLMREQGSGTRGAVERFFAEHQMPINASMEMNTNEAIKQGVEVGLGLGIVSIRTVEDELESGRLVMLDVESFPIRRHWYLVHHSGKRLSGIAQAFKEFVRSEGHSFVKPILPAADEGEGTEKPAEA
jgi:DNA-binding transcriptional LysR family regulator